MFWGILSIFAFIFNLPGSNSFTSGGQRTPILRPPDKKSWLTGKDPDAGKDGKEEEKGMTEDKMVGWHHGLKGHEFEQTLRVGEGQGSLACSPWGHKQSDTTERLNNNKARATVTLGSITMNKASGGDGIPVELFQILKDDAVKVLHSICQQIWKPQQWPQDWKRSLFTSIPKKGNAKVCSNYHTQQHSSHMLAK